MKKWPQKDTELVSFSDLIDPVRKAFKKAYHLVSKNHKSIPYTGYNFGPSSLVTLPPPKELLDAEGIQHNKEQGRDILDIILLIAFNLGVEQGRRMEREHTNTYKLLSEMRSSIEKSDRIKVSL